jgi:phospholipase/lecithinase/hemolysin
MAYPNSLITNNTPGVDIYPPQPGQAFGSNPNPPSGGPSNPDHPTLMARITAELVAIEQALGPNFVPAAASLGPVLGIQNLYVFGDSYSDPGNYQAVQSQGFPAYESNGPCWPVYIADALGLTAAALPRWGNGYPAATNYAFTGATVNSSSVFQGHAWGLNYQVSTFLSDVGGAVPAGSLILLSIGTNDAISFGLNQIGGMPTAADPVTTTNGGFTQPASGGSVTIPMSDTTSFATGQFIWLVNAGGYTITSVTAGVSVTATLNTVFSAIIQPGNPVPSGLNVRWLAAQWMDESLNGGPGFPGLVQALNSLVGAGATKILVFDIGDPAITPEYAPKGTTGTNCTNYWNSKLGPLVAGYSQCTLFSEKAVFTNIVNNPPAYGIYNLDSWIIFGATQDATDSMMWANNFHPSAATHRILSQAVLSAILNLYSGGAGGSYQTRAAPLTLPASMAPNLAPAPQFASPTGFQVAPWVGTKLPQIITSADLRLARSTYAVDSPFGMRRCWIDFNSGTVPDPNYKSTQNKVGTGNAQSQIGLYGGDFGGCYMYTSALNDVYGEIYTGAAYFITAGGGAASGKLHLGYRFAMPMANAGDTVTLQVGLGDSLTAFNNGIYWNLSNTNGVVTGNVIIMQAGVQTVSPALTIPNLPINGNGAVLLELKTDADVWRFAVYVGGIYQFFWTPKVNISGGVALNPFHQIKRTVFVSGISGVVADGLLTIQFLART